MYPAFGDVTWITPYGLMLVFALAACWLYARHRAEKFAVDKSHVDLAVPLIFIISTVGARWLATVGIGDVDVAGPHSRFRLFGLLFLSLPLLFAYSRVAGLSFRHMADLFALPVVLWLIVLRIGCFMAGCCWGEPSEWLSAMSFPAGSLAYEQQLALGLITVDAALSLPAHPTQLYELFLLVLLLAGLLKLEPGQRSPGLLAISTVSGYSVLRFIVEFLRADNSPVLVDPTLTQLICVSLLIASAVAWRPLRSRPGLVA